jgi:uncharacterized protein with HEPN domain
VRDTTLYIKDILAAVDSIEKFVDSMDFETFHDDDKTLSAVIRKNRLPALKTTLQRAL